MKLRKKMVALAAICTLFSGCKSSLEGTYSDAMGSTILELRSGGKANFTWMGNVLDCSYKGGGTSLTLTCKDDANPTVFNIHDDGSLTGPPGTFMPPLRKQK